MTWLIVAAYLVVAVLMMRQFGRRYAAWMIARNRKRDYRYDFFAIDKFYTVVTAIVGGVLFPVAILPVIFLFLLRRWRVSEWFIPQIGERRRAREAADLAESEGKHLVSLADGLDDNEVATTLYRLAKERSEHAVQLRKSLGRWE